jgi:hypothetical protein
MSGVDATLSGRTMAETCVFGRDDDRESTLYRRDLRALPARPLHQP